MRAYTREKDEIWKKKSSRVLSNDLHNKTYKLKQDACSAMFRQNIVCQENQCEKPLSQEQDQKVSFVSTVDKVCIGQFTFWKMASKVCPVIPNHWLC